jgi:RecB family exonuclease
VPVDLSSALTDTKPSVGALPEHISFSQLDTFIRCPRAWQAKYLQRVPSVVQDALIVGSSVHAGVGAYYESKLRDKRISKSQRVHDATSVTSDTFAEMRYDDTKSVILDQSERDLEQQAISMVETYIAEAPRVTPRAIEQKITLRLDDSDIPLIGAIDVVAEECLLELKTSAKSVTKPQSSWRLQALLYQAAMPGLRTDWHVLVKNKTPKLVHGAGLSQPFDAEATSRARSLAGRTLERIQQLYATLGPDEEWPAEGILHPFACGYCSVKADCELGSLL